jgi:hypothetical protein
VTGYQRLTAPDPAEQALREAWYKAKETADLYPSPSNDMAFYKANSALSDFLWRRANGIVQADRLKSPKAKRNLPVGSMGSGGGRILP